MKELTYIVISLGWDGFPVAYKLQQEGCTVMVGQVQSKEELGQEDEESPEEAEKRLKQYDGMLDKMPAKKLIEALKEVENKDEYFIFFDQNNLYKYAQELLDAGFTKGLFPTEEDFEFEKDREKAMQFVNENYPDIQIIPYEEFSNIDNAINFIKKANKVYVIQSKGDHVSTMVPQGNDIETERQQMIDQLEKNKDGYNQGGIILKEKLISPIEITPQMVFFDGKPVFTDLDLETKNIGDGENNGNQVGCGSDLVIKTEFEDRINELAFPTAVHEMAMTRTGLFVFDISLYLMATDGTIYFGEFCPNRFGYDSIMTEIAMAESAKDFFTKITEGINPLVKKFGSAVRLFNLSKQEDREVITDSPNAYLYEVYKGQDDKILSTGYCWDLGVAVGAGDTITDSVEDTYKTVSEVSFKEMYHKTKHDFYDSYSTSIIFRFNETNHVFYNAPDFEAPDEKLAYEKKIRDMEIGHSTSLSNFRSQVSNILNEDND